MIPADVLLPFTLAAFALCIAPGTDNIFVLTQSAVHGRRTGILVTLGLCSGLLLHIGAVALGVAALFQTVPLTFTLLKICGALYLLYLARGAFCAGAQTVGGDAATVPARAAALYGRGIIMNVTNPKVAVFFLAFLPQFTDPQYGSVPLQIVTLGLIFIAVALVTFCLIALLAARLGGWLKRSERAQIYINRVAGTVFVLLAARLLLTRP